MSLYMTPPRAHADDRARLITLLNGTLGVESFVAVTQMVIPSASYPHEPLTAAFLMYMLEVRFGPLEFTAKFNDYVILQQMLMFDLMANCCDDDPVAFEKMAKVDETRKQNNEALRQSVQVLENQCGTPLGYALWSAEMENQGFLTAFLAHRWPLNHRTMAAPTTTVDAPPAYSVSRRRLGFNFDEEQATEA